MRDIATSRGFDDEKLASGRATVPLWAAVAAIVGPILLLGGYRRMTDPDLPGALAELAHGARPALNPHEGFKFEGLLADAGLFLLGKLDLGPEPTALVFWAAGLAAVAGALLWSLRNGSVSAPALLCLIAFTRIVDTFSLWVGKTDPWLVAFAILSANRVRRVSRLGIVLAAFVHPMIAVLSTLGVLLVDAVYDRKPRWGDAGLAIVVTGSALVLFRLVFPALQGRGGYLLEQVLYVGLRGAEDGLPSLVAGVVAPSAALLLLAGCRQGTNAVPGVALLVWLGGVAVLTSFLTLDHTRDACLITFAAALAWLRRQAMDGGEPRTAATGRAFAALLAFRLVVPHYDQDGGHTFRWPPITRWSEPLIGRILDHDRAQCSADPLRCVYHRNPSPEIRVPTL